MKTKIQYLKYIIFIILSLIIVLSTVLKDEQTLVFAKGKKISEENRIKTEASPLTEIKIEEKAVLRLAENSEVVIKKNLNKFPQIEIEFLKGEIWMAKFFGDPAVTVRVGKLQVSPTRGFFSAEFIDNEPVFHAVNYPLFLDKKPVFETKEPQDEWISGNKNLDAKFLENYLQNRVKKILEKGSNFTNLKTQKILKKISNLFTLRNSAESARNSNQLKKILEDFEYFMIVGKKDEADERLDAIRESVLSYKSPAADLAVLTYAREYPELQKLISSEEIKNVLLLEVLFPLFDSGIDSKSIFNSAKSYLENIKDPEIMDAERQILENVLNEKREMFSKEAFELLAILQKPDSLALLDLMQKLKDVKNLMENDLTASAEGKNAAVFLLSRIRTLQNILDKDDLIKPIIDADLDELQQFFGFLSSKEIDGGGTFQEKFNAFVEKEKELEELRAAAQESTQIPGKKGVPVAAVEKVKNDFERIGIKDAVLLAKEGKISVENASFSGVNFSGEYDFEKKVFTDLKIKDIKINYAVSLANFPRIVIAIIGGNIKIEKPAEEKIEPAEPAETKLAKIAKAKVLEKLINLGILANEENIKAKDIEEGSFLVETKEAQFEFLNNTNEIQNLQVKTVLGILMIPEKFSAASLKQRIELLQKRASFESKPSESEPSE